MNEIEKIKGLLEEIESEIKEKDEKLEEWENSNVGELESKIGRMNWLIKDVLIPLLPEDKIPRVKEQIEKYGFENKLWEIVQELEAY